MKKLKQITLIAFLAMSLNSCENLEDLNTNTKAYETVVPEALMTTAQEQYAIFLNNASVSRNTFSLL